MATLWETQLDWIQRNRRRSPRARSAGGLMVRLVDGLDDKARAGVRDAANSLSALVDDDFREHCRLTPGAGDRLMVNVDHAGLVYPMRAKWLPLLTRELVAGRRSGGARSIAFAYGRDGIAVGKPATKRADKRH